VSYFQIFKSFLREDNIITIPIKNSSVNTDIRAALYVSNALWNIEKHGWKLNINNSSDDLVIYENKQKGVKIYSRMDDALRHCILIEEIFVWEVYKSDFKNKVVIDVGVYRGESAIYFAVNGAKKVIALEPDEDSYKLALMNVKENSLENKIILLNKALAPSKGVINFYKDVIPIFSSTYPNNIPSPIDKIVVKQVEALTLDEVIKIGEERG